MNSKVEQLALQRVTEAMGVAGCGVHADDNFSVPTDASIVGKRFAQNETEHIGRVIMPKELAV